jgi:hypothetical protein
MPAKSIKLSYELTRSLRLTAQKIHHPVEFSSIQINEQGWVHLDSDSSGDYQMVTHPELEIALSWIKI